MPYSGDWWKTGGGQKKDERKDEGPYLVPDLYGQLLSNTPAYVSLYGDIYQRMLGSRLDAARYGRDLSLLGPRRRLSDIGFEGEELAAREKFLGAQREGLDTLRRNLEARRALLGEQYGLRDRAAALEGWMRRWEEQQRAAAAGAVAAPGHRIRMGYLRDTTSRQRQLLRLELKDRLLNLSDQMARLRPEEGELELQKTLLDIAKRKLGAERGFTLRELALLQSRLNSQLEELGAQSLWDLYTRFGPELSSKIMESVISPVLIPGEQGG